ncbi:hypothetical protein NDU88_002710 [Pleurodeles waltl]|uniref:Uncharacterized protein n=1 Tax=Pleurodeles waltl TaxID=8319 RepID=A0AAV7NED5_PLEWA|nr:hypothetical protein NDU88_002710 [Pleurodeles waltl]
MAPGLEGAYWVEGVLRACRGDTKRDPTWTRRAGPKETQQQGGGRSRWAPIAGRSAPTPGVGAERTRGLTLWTHKNLSGCTEEQEEMAEARNRRPGRERSPGGQQRNLGRGAFRPRTVMSKEAPTACGIPAGLV